MCSDCIAVVPRAVVTRKRAGPGFDLGFLKDVPALPYFLGLDHREYRVEIGFPSLISKTYQGIGYWRHQEPELDVVGLADDWTLVAGGCPDTNRTTIEGDLTDVERTVSPVQWAPSSEIHREEEYCCFFRSGFTDELQTMLTDRHDGSLFIPLFNPATVSPATSPSDVSSQSLSVQSGGAAFRLWILSAKRPNTSPNRDAQ